MWKSLSRVLPTRRQMVEMVQQRLRWTASACLCLVVVLSVSAADRWTAHSFAAETHPENAVDLSIDADSSKLADTIPRQVYDRFLKKFTPLQRQAERRQYLVGQILAAATEHQVDPDLLFALIAVESGFNSAATSPKGARGLGQVMLTTARAVAPNVIRGPRDLYDVRRNLYVTALEIRRLLDKWAGDVWGALGEYAGVPGRSAVQHGRSPYVARICMYYALLKTKRHYDDLIARGMGRPEPVSG
jgi:soluble lytic murein transglycosylase-like protein